ncbi:MAG: GNAT family N-acetyltransferase [Chloroflexota bacterium]|nr:GNAT family N-acetyltransferase [Chloroflexota bacterium]
MMGKAASVRQATPADIPAIVTLINEADKVYRTIIPPERWREPFMTEDRLQAEWSKREYLVAEADSEIASAVAWQAMEPAIYLGRLFVYPHRQRQGIGHALLEAVEGRTRKVGGEIISLIVNPKATWAVRFYEKYDYVKKEIGELGEWVEALKERLPEGIDWMVMIKWV